MQLMSKLLMTTLLAGSLLNIACAKEDTPHETKTKKEIKKEAVKKDMKLTAEQKHQKRLLEYVKRAISVNKNYKLTKN